MLLGAVKVIAFVGGLTGAALLVMFGWDWVTDGPTKRASLNRDIFTAFRAIERQCMSEAWPDETVRCHKVLKKMESCGQTSDRCQATEYYCALIKFGFDEDLPPYYRTNSTYRNKSPC